MLCCALLVAASPARAQLGGPLPPEPADVLAAAKAASGGAAWDTLSSQHSKVAVFARGVNGQAERWSDITTGRSYVAYSIGPVSGAAGFDGTVAWTQDAAGRSQVETNDVARELAVNAAYRDRLAFWYPERGGARIHYKERTSADGAEFDVIRITPDGGRPFELWVNTQTRLIERLVEREAAATRTETYMDIRDVAGVKIPFRVRASRGDPRSDEVVVVDTMEFNRPLAGVPFAQPPPPAPDFAFPAGTASVDVPFEVHGGHLFVRAMLNGKGPYRLLFDSGGVNVLLPQVAAQIGASPAAADAGPAPAIGVARVDRVDFGGIVLERQAFATIDLGDVMRRVDGVDNVAGVIGYELLKRFPIKLDFERSRAVFYEPSRFVHEGGGAKLPVAFRGTVPHVRAKLDGIGGDFLLDTGSRGSLTLTHTFAADHDLAGRYDAKITAVYGSGTGGVLRGRLARAGALELAGYVIAAPVTSLSLAASGADADLAGNIGYGILRRFNVTFDYPGNAIWLARNANFGEPDVYDRAGAWIERTATGFEVVDVIADGPAAAAGLRAGDMIIGVDGRPWSALTLSALRDELKAAPGRKVRLAIAGRGERVVTLRDLL